MNNPVISRLLAQHPVVIQRWCAHEDKWVKSHRAMVLRMALPWKRVHLRLLRILILTVHLLGVPNQMPQTNFLHPSLLSSLSVRLLVKERTPLDKCTSCFLCDLRFWEAGKCRESHNWFVQFLSNLSLHNFWCLFERWTVLSGRPAFRRMFPFVSRLRSCIGRRSGTCSALTRVVAEIASVLPCTLSCCFPVIALYLFPFHADRLPFAFTFRNAPFTVQS